MKNSLNILVAEHDRDVAEGLCDVLDLAGHRVRHAVTADETCELLQSHDFDVAFVNVKIEGRSRLESFAEVRKIKSDAKIVMMSAHTIDQLTAEVTDGGMVKVLSAPDDMDSVVSALGAVGPAGTVLIEDVPADFGTTLQAAFAERNSNAAIARDRDEALAKVAQANSDLLLLDLRLTAIRNLEVYLEVRRQGYSQPIIIFQSHADDGPANTGIWDSDILYKPFDPGLMVKLLEDMAATLHGGTVSEVPAIAAAPDSGGQAAKPDAQDSGGAAERQSGDVLLWDEAGPMPARAAETDTAGDPGPRAEPDPVSETPPALVEAPVQGEQPEASRPDGGKTGMSDAESPGEARLPAGVGLSVAQLEQAIVAAEDPGSGSTAVRFKFHVH